MRRLGEPPPKAWMLDHAYIQASALRTSHVDLIFDAKCCTSQAEGATVT